MVRGDGKVADLEEVLSRGELVRVEQHLLQGVGRAAAAAVDRMLLARLEALVVEKVCRIGSAKGVQQAEGAAAGAQRGSRARIARTVDALERSDVGLLHVMHELRINSVLKRLQVRRLRLCIAVLLVDVLLHLAAGERAERAMEGRTRGLFQSRSQK